MLKRATSIEGACIIIFVLFFFIFPTTLRKGYCEEPMGIIDEVRKIELNDIKCDQESVDYFGYIKGNIPILISAPHGAKHYRSSESQWKAEDAYTSSFAIKLGQLTGAHVIYAKNKSVEDPNNDTRSRYKDFLGKVVKENGIKFIIDIHGAGRNRPFKIDVGTMNNKTEKSSCPTFMPTIERAFRGFDERIFNKRFSAKGCGTITYFAKNDLGIEAAQFEISPGFRTIESRVNPSLRAKEQDVLDLMGRMKGMILDINKKISGDI